MPVCGHGCAIDCCAVLHLLLGLQFLFSILKLIVIQPQATDHHFCLSSQYWNGESSSPCIISVLRHACSHIASTTLVCLAVIMLLLGLALVAFAGCAASVLCRHSVPVCGSCAVRARYCSARAQNVADCTATMAASTR